MTARLVATVLNCALLALAAPVAAEEEKLSPAPGVPAGPMLHGKLELSLAAAIAMGLENNLDVQVQRYGPILSGYDEEIAWGAYDPEFFGEFRYSDVTRPTSFVLEGVETVTDRSRVGFGGFRGIVPLLSTEYSGQFDGGRYSTDQTFESLSPKLESGWSLRLSQPLLKDLIWNEPWTQVKTTRILLESSREDFRRGKFLFLHRLYQRSRGCEAKLIRSAKMVSRIESAASFRSARILAISFGTVHRL